MESEGLQKNIILMVDDNPTNLGVLYNTLNVSGYKLLVAQDGQSALDQIHLMPPDVILLDVMMPGLDGFEVCRRLKANESTKDIPVIFMTSLSEIENKVKAFEVGAVDYVTKPLQSLEVLARVKAHLAIRNLQLRLEDKNSQIEGQNMEIEAQRDRVIETNKLLEEALRNLCETQDRLIHAEKMAAIGQMVAGLAHEINNPLGMIQGTLGFFKHHINKRNEMHGTLQPLRDGHPRATSEDFANDTRDAEALIDIFQNGTDRIKKIVEALQDFSRFDQSNLEFVRIHDELNHALMSLRSDINHRITVIRRFDVVPAIEGYSGKISQVFFQVLLNAVQSIPDRGVITVTTEVGDSFVKVTVSDTGIGIKQELRSKVFDPFFTTREVGQGMGLGLSLSYGIVKTHHGTIEIGSNEVNGTKVTIRLPIQQPESLEESPWISTPFQTLVS